jgi:hypothetical protein
MESETAVETATPLTNGGAQPTPVTVAEPAAATPAKKPRRARESTARFPCYITCNLTAAMGQALMRMTPPGGPFTQSQYLRTVIHMALMRDDPIYAKGLSTLGGTNNV